MKKILALVLASMLLLSFAACSKDETTSDTNNTEVTETVDTSTPAGALLAAFKTAVASETDPEALANTVVSDPVVEFSPVVMPVEPGYLNGFSAEITGFDSGAVFAPMIGSIPFVGYIFTVSGDVDAFVAQLKENADLRWNICTSADEMVCEAVGNTVFFVMAPATFAE